MLAIKIQIGHYKEDTKHSSITCQDVTQGQMSNEVALRMVEWDQTADETGFCTDFGGHWKLWVAQGQNAWQPNPKIPILC